MRNRGATKGLVALAASILLSAGAASAQEFKLGHSLSVTSHYGVGAEAMAAEIARLSGGRITIRQFPSGALGGEREMIEGLQIGSIDLVMTSTGPTGNFVPETQIFDIPFLFRDVAHARAVLDGPIGQRVLDAFTRQGIIALAWTENGFRSMTNSKRPIRTPEDARGLKIRTMENTVHMAAFRGIGALPTPMAFPELFTALQQGVVDGQENPIAVIVAARFAQVQKHLSLTQHVYSPCLILVSADVWNKLSAREKEWMRAAAKAGAKGTRDSSLEADANGIEELRKAGMEIIADVDKTAFVNALQPAYAEFARKFGQDRIDEIRNFK